MFNENLNKENTKNNKCKGEIKKKLKGQRKQVKVDIIRENARDVVKEFKKSLELQEYLKSYEVGIFKMACKDFRRNL